MTKKAQQNGVDVDEEITDVEQRKDGISRALEEMAQLDDKVAAATEKHLTPLRDKKSKIVKRIRKAYGMPADVFHIRYAGYKRERRAHQADDQPTLRALTEMYEIAPPGVQLSLLPPDPPPAKKKPTRAAKKKPDASAGAAAPA